MPVTATFKPYNVASKSLRGWCIWWVHFGCIVKLYRVFTILGISVNTVKSFCRRNIMGKAIAAPAKALSGETTYCENCGKELRQIAKQKPKRFCCDKCRNSWWNTHLDQVKRKKVYRFKCPHCGKEFQIYGDSRRKYCSHACYIADRFKGGERDE